MTLHLPPCRALAALIASLTLSLLSLRAQDAAPPPAAAADQGAPGLVRMSQFEVTTTQGHGYTSTNAASGFKTDESLMDIPQLDIVVTNDFIMDMGYENSTDLLQYFGASNGFQGESMAMRGLTIAYPYIDEMPENDSFQDNAYIDSYEVIKGPTETLYLSTSLAGVVLKTTKKPLPYEQNIITASINEWGLVRTTIDTTGPIGQVGDLKLLYRFVAVYQDGRPYFYNVKDNRFTVFPEIEGLYHNTSIRLFYNFQDFHSELNGIDLVTPSGGLYTGAGRQESNYPPNDLDHYQQHDIDLEVLQKISDTWENRLMASDWRYARLGAEALVTGSYDWAKQIEYMAPRYDEQIWSYWSILDDTSGHYSLGPPNWEMRNVDAFGFSFSNTETEFHNENLSIPYPGVPLLSGQPAGTMALPMNSAAAINAYQVPPLSLYSPAANFGSNNQVFISAIYAQHTIDVIPNWLTLIGGWTWYNVRSESVSNISNLPWQAAVIPVGQFIHRLAAVVHLTKAVSLYAMTATNLVSSNVSVVLQNGNLAPPQGGISHEMGMKTNFLGGKLSTEFAWFKLTTTNQTQQFGLFANGNPYSIIVGSTNEEGVDGDVQMTLVPGWQVIGSFYAGHDRDLNNVPVSRTYDNQWSIFTRYDFAGSNALKGWTIGGGVSKIGGRWLADTNIVDAAGLVPPSIAGESPEIKIASQPLLNGFIGYSPTKHWLFRINAYNILNETYPLGLQQTSIVDPSPPLTFTFSASYKF